MIHIDDWLDDSTTGPPELKRWFEAFRKPAMYKDHHFLNSKVLTCTYQGKRYRCTGCSRLGDVWLNSDMSTTHGYEHRVDIMDCTDWKINDSH